MAAERFERRPEGAGRLFFALWPDERVADQMAEVGRALQGIWGGRRIAAPQLHLTLAFLGEQPAAALPVLLSVGESMRAAPICLGVDTAGCWRHNGVGWLGTSVAPAGLAALVDELRLALRALGFAVEGRSYVPHVTVLRKARCGGGTPAFPTIAWRSDHLLLMRSSLHPAGASYEAVGAWALAG